MFPYPRGKKVDGANSSIKDATLSTSILDEVTMSQAKLENLASSTADSVPQKKEAGSETAVESATSTIASDPKNNHNFRNTLKAAVKKVKANKAKTEKVDDQMSYEHLEALEEIFEGANTEGADGLSMEQFRVAMKMTMGEHIDDRQLDLLFMKVDNNCDGTVEWDEYLSYMLLEYQEKENMFSMDEIKPFPTPMVEKLSSHTELICRIAMMQATSSRPRHNDRTNTEDAASRYLTLSREGTLNVWNLEWQLQKTMSLRGSVKSIWFTDLACMANCNCFVVSSSEYEISFYALTSNLIQKKFQLKGLDCCALTLDYAHNRRNPERATLMWGDTGGNVFIIRFLENPTVALLSNTKFPGGKCSLAQLLKTDSPYVKAFKISDVHTDWVRQVRYFSNKKGQEFLISCCGREDTALFFADVTETKTWEKSTNSRRTYFHIQKGVICLSYDAEWNLIVTGSRDCDVRVWNPFVVRRSLAVLKGHHASILQVLVISADHQVISISKDSNIRIWDLRYYTCKQNINGRSVNLGRLGITSAYFYEKRKELVVGTNRIGIFYPRGNAKSTANRKQAEIHQKAVTCVLYNKLFHQIVTGGEDSMVRTWDMNTGKKSMQFCTEEGVEITSMTFDPTWRRLVTGLRNGAVMLWNFNNGACLRHLTNSDGLEITDVLFSKQRIVTGGWSKCPIVYMDSYTDDSCFPLNRKHSDDIMSLDYHRKEAMLASAAYDGDIYVWSLETQSVIVAFNMHKSLLPMHISSRNKTTANLTQNTGQTSVLKLRTKDGASSQDEVKGVQTEHENAHYTANGVETNSLGTWLPTTLPWLHTEERKNQTESKTKVHFADKIQEVDDSDDETDVESEEEDFCEITHKALYKVLFLQSRRNRDSSAILVASNAQGWITAWSANSKGGLLGYFQATKRKNEMVVTMETDSNDGILITGDSRGYIKIWNIASYCDGDDVKGHRKAQDDEERRNSSSSECEVIHYMPRTSPPELQTSFRGHPRAITSVAFIEKHSLIASGSVDCSIRLWTISGRYVGTFGQSDPWSLELLTEPFELSTLIPDNIRRVASKRTLNTIRGGLHTQWEEEKNTMNLLRGGNSIDEGSSSGKDFPANTFINNRLKAVEMDILEESLKKPGSRRKSVTVWMDDIPHAIGVVRRPVDKVEKCFLRIQSEGISSSVLGKTNYKPKKRHRKAKINADIKWFDQHASIYNLLPYSSLEHPSEPAFPDYVKKLQSPSEPTAASFRSAMIRQKAAGRWYRRCSRIPKETDSTLRGLMKSDKVAERNEQHIAEANSDKKNQNQGTNVSKLPPVLASLKLRLPGKKKHAPFALPSIAT